jgi:hypothetical protein
MKLRGDEDVVGQIRVLLIDDNVGVGKTIRPTFDWENKADGVDNVSHFLFFPAVSV